MTELTTSATFVPTGDGGSIGIAFIPADVPKPVVIMRYPTYPPQGEPTSFIQLSQEEYEKLQRDTPNTKLPDFKPRKPGTNANGNTLGPAVGDTPSTQVPAKQANPEVKPETPKEGSWWSSWGSSITHTVLDVGGEKDLEGGAVLDLGVELARGAEGQHRLVACVLLELGGDLLHGGGEVGGHGHLHLIRPGGGGGEGAQEGGGEDGGGTAGQGHGGSPKVVKRDLGKAEIRRWRRGSRWRP